jgi:hypothetical protein
MTAPSFSSEVVMSWYEQAIGASSNWRTPRTTFEQLGFYRPDQPGFDVDVASPGAEHVKWLPAKRHITKNSLKISWASFGFIWMNAPFNDDEGHISKRNGLLPWLNKFTPHGHGIALLPDRSSAPWWQQHAPHADLILFVSPKIQFIDVDGTPGKSPAQGTSLFAIGERGCEALRYGAAHGLGVLMRPVFS